MTESTEKMTAEQLQDFVAVLELKTTSFTSQAVIAALQAAIALGGFAPYRIAMIVANAVAKTVVGRGLGLAANAGLVRLPESSAATDQMRMLSPFRQGRKSGKAIPIYGYKKHAGKSLRVALHRRCPPARYSRGCPCFTQTPD